MGWQAGNLVGDSGEFVSPDCMAKYMEDALFALAGPPPDPEDSGKLGRRQFFIAISQGVIDYLKDHDGASFVRVSVGSGNNTQQGVWEVL